ncbi:MAG TPA: amino acid permease [Pirellulales bacterium]
MSEQSPAAPRRQLTLFDTTSIIVGIIIGSSVYVTAPRIAACVPDAFSFLLVWLLGGAFALVGSLCYAELATALPHDGGDYVYLSRAYGRPAGLMFAWCELWLVRPGAIGSLAYVFAEYADEVVPLGRHAPVIYAAGCTAAMTAINLLGVAAGKWTQNILTLAKVLGLAAVIVVGFCTTAPAVSPRAEAPISTDWGLAFIFILYAYGGWNDMAFVSAEVRHPERNILRALLAGTLAVTGIYLLINASFLHALGLEGVRQGGALAAEVVGRQWNWGAQAVSLLVAVSALGAVNGMTFTAARIYYAMGARHRLFAPLGVWSARFDGPARAILLQGGITLALILAVGLTSRGAAQQGFETMASFTFPPFWFFLSLVGLAVIVLRLREPQLPRPYRTPAFPLLPIIFCAGAGYMVFTSVVYAARHFGPAALGSLAVVVAGLIAVVIDAFWRTPAA